ncbi:MAG TPA: hypothetical protein VMM38_14345 [Aridibacter sp.]|nr:hypothetical protein [Aridibacter sp.]
MRILRIASSIAICFAALLFTAGYAFGQGNSGNRPAGPPSNPGGGPPINPGGGPPVNPGGRPIGIPGVDRGLERARIGSNGRVDDGLGTASINSDGKVDRGLNTARDRSTIEGIPVSIEERRFIGLARKLDTTPGALLDAFRASRQTNPELPFGLFVAANVIADHVSTTHPEITTEAILLGLESGRNLGQTLQDLGLSSKESKFLKKVARDRIEKGDEDNDR